MAIIFIVKRVEPILTLDTVGCMTVKHTLSLNQRSKIDTFFSKDTKFATVNAETLFTSYLIEHNIPVAVSDHAGPLFKRMFPDSKIGNLIAEQRQLQCSCNCGNACQGM